MKDLSHLKRQINKQLSELHGLHNMRRALLSDIKQEVTVLKSVRHSCRNGIVPQYTYQSYKASTTPLRHALHCQVVKVKADIKDAKAELQTLQAAHLLGLQAQQELQKDNLFLEGQNIYTSLTKDKREALDHYMLSKSYARTN